MSRNNCFSQVQILHILLLYQFVTYLLIVPRIIYGGIVRIFVLLALLNGGKTYVYEFAKLLVSHITTFEAIGLFSPCSQDAETVYELFYTH
jgi:hypothetical protein